MLLVPYILQNTFFSNLTKRMSYVSSSLGAGPLFKQSLISLGVKRWNEVNLNYFTEAIPLRGLTVSFLVDIVAHFRNSPHFSIGLILTDVIQMLGKFKWSIHNKTSTWNSCKKRNNQNHLSIFFISCNLSKIRRD